MHDVTTLLEQAKKLRLEVAAGFDVKRPDQTSGNVRWLKIVRASELEQQAAKAASVKF